MKTRFDKYVCASIAQIVSDSFLVIISKCLFFPQYFSLIMQGSKLLLSSSVYKESLVYTATCLHDAKSLCDDVL